MKKTLIICCLLLATAAFGQKNAVKLVLAPGKLITANNIGLMYERKITDRFSASLKFNFSSKGVAPFSGRLSDFAKDYLDSANAAANIFDNKFTSSGLTLELRYYPGKKALKGFYLAPYFGFQKGTFANFDFEFPDQDNPLVSHGGNVEMGFNFIGGGIGFGNQWILGDKISIDILWFGLGLGTSEFRVLGTEQPGQQLDFDKVEMDVQEFLDSQTGIIKNYTDKVDIEKTTEFIKLTSNNLTPYMKFFNFSIGYAF